MLLKNIIIYWIYLSFLFLIFFQLINSNSFNSELPYFLPLRNGDLLIIKENEILFYQTNLSKIIDFNNFYFNRKMLNNNNNNQTFLITKFHDKSEDYILFLKNENIYYFDESGKNIFSFNIENIIINSNIFLLDSYKKINSDFYFILGINQSSEVSIKILKLNTDLKNINEVQTKKFKSLFNSDMNCHIMYSTLYGKVLACFYSTKEFPHFLYASIFEIYDELGEILKTKYYNQLPLSEINFKTIITENRKKIIIYYTDNIALYFSYYLIETNEFQFLTKINLITSFSSIFDLININNEYVFKNDNYYTFINKVFYFLNKEIKIINKVDNTIIGKNENNNKFISYISNKNKLVRILNDALIKCKTTDEIGFRNSLCLECNTEKGYYPLFYSYYKNIQFQNYFKYIDCYNNETKPMNYFFNPEIMVYEK